MHSCVILPPSVVLKECSSNDVLKNLLGLVGILVPRVRYKNSFVIGCPSGSDGDANSLGWMVEKNFVKHWKFKISDEELGNKKAHSRGNYLQANNFTDLQNRMGLHTFSKLNFIPSSSRSVMEKAAEIICCRITVAVCRFYGILPEKGKELNPGKMFFVRDNPCDFEFSSSHWELFAFNHAYQRICKEKLMCRGKRDCSRHINSVKHKKIKKGFMFDLLLMLCAGDVPLNILDKQPFREFRNKYVSDMSLPDRSMLHNYLPTVRSDSKVDYKCIQNIRLWLCVDETTDCKYETYLLNH
ncbi:hypothetical protein NQ318_022876 [Aromia moschata]|uniref:Uncharacterized protein n=1 Tax=Aromia moschata TaxID=1265417 RepID=A0AAV8XIW8_9CUCU|nr:hypothetical protein NQ318_022876 [Aromia moschata]